MVTILELINSMIITTILSSIISSLISDFVLNIRFDKKNLMTFINAVIFYYLMYRVELHHYITGSETKTSDSIQ